MELLIREVTIQDSDLLLAWRNEAEVRKFSHQQKVISRQEHSEWFNNRLKHLPLQPFWMFENDEEAVGFVRFDFDSIQNHFEISITINSLLRGKGFGKRILSLSIENCISLNSGIDLYAEAHQDNKASQLLFLNCGFKEIESHNEFLIFKRFTDFN
jgi:RimJ/RimL family protein N-acetyltransferase